MGKQVHKKNGSSQTKSSARPLWNHPVLLGTLLAALSFLLYANTLSHGFVLDDVLVITKNKFTLQGISGWKSIFSTDTFFGYYQTDIFESAIAGGRYRPFSLAYFALLYQIFGPQPFWFHLGNVLLFAGLAFLLYFTLQRLLHPQAEHRPDSIAFIATLLFAAHPVHTEVVANIKCADELFSLLFSTATLHLILKGWDTQQSKWYAWAGITFLAAAFSKENALTFLAIIPMALWLFRKTNRPSISALIQPLLPSLISAGIYLIARTLVLGLQFGGKSYVLINNPFIKWDGNKWIDFSFGEWSASIVYGLGYYLKLLLFPYPLTHDYYPRQFNILHWDNFSVIVSLIVYIGLLTLVVTRFSKSRIITFCIIYYLASVSIVSNIIFPIGTHISERFLFMPSVAFCLAITYLLLTSKNKLITYSILGIILILYSLKTVDRNFDWKDNFTLAEKDIEFSIQSAKLNNSYAAQLLEKAIKSKQTTEKSDLLQKSLFHYQKAIEINPIYLEALYGKGSVYFVSGNYTESVKYYLQAEKIDPNFPNLRQNLALSLREAGKTFLAKNDLENAFQFLSQAQARYPNDPEINTLIEQIRAK